MGDPYEMWDVTTDQGRWWVVTNPTNLYSQQHFPSLDYTLSFHVGLMARIRSRSGSPDGNDPTPFDEVLRRFEQAGERFGHAIEVEDLQAIGMLLREGLISLTTAVHRRVVLPQDVEVPQIANFVAWSDALLNVLCGGGSNERLRQYLKSHAKETWQLVNWLTHSRSADRVATEIAIGGCEATLRTFIQLLERLRTGGAEECPSCRSRNIRTFFDIQDRPHIAPGHFSPPGKKGPLSSNASKLSKGPSGSLLFVQCRLDQLSFGHRGQAIANAAARVPERYP